MLKSAIFTFINAIYAAIIAVQCQDFTAMGNRITANTMNGKTGPNNMGFGIVVQGFGFKEVVIQDNYVNLEQAGETPTSWSTMSFVVTDTVADIDIRGNHCFNDTLYGIALLDNYGVMSVENNFVGLGFTGYNPAGIIVFQTKPTGQEARGNAYVLNNTVVCNEKGEGQAGIVLGNLLEAEELGFSSVEKNHITFLDGSFTGVGIALVGQDNAYVGQNKLEGKSFFGIVLISVEGSDVYGPADNNVLVGNNISNFETMV